MAETVYSVHQVTQALQELLEQAIPPLWIEGEISNFHASQAGHWYFTLKDARAQLPCVMWRNLALRHQHLRPSDGMLIRVFGTLGIYPQGGVYQIVATRLLPVGRGALQIAFEALRDRLREEGIFDPNRKRPLPRFPTHIGVVTSPTGAALRDIVNVLSRRFPAVRVSVYPSLVQGDEAPPQIARAIGIANRIGEADVLIVGRGGGSMEDLWAFNEEVVVRAIADSTIPVVSAVGHEVDFTLADFAADERAATPSAAAERVVPDRQALRRDLANIESRMREAMTGRIRLARQELDRIRAALSPRRRLDAIHQQSQYLDDLAQRLERAMKGVLERGRHQLRSAATALNALSPLATLERGYSICYDTSDRIVTGAEAVDDGDRIRVRLHRGSLEGVVTRRLAPAEGESA